MIHRGLLQRLYDAASIQRWNDHARPFEMVELGKQAHKMVLAFVIGRFEQEDRRAGLDWLGIIEGSIFEFLHRIILTDIKPTVFHRMMAEKGRELNRYVLAQIEEDIADIGGGFRDRFQRYFFDEDYLHDEKRILQAAHYLATDWEFRFIYQLNRPIYGIEQTKAEIENRLEDFFDLIGVQKISLGKKSFGFVDLCGQLRFQKRWSGTIRVPQTSVLGHMLIVAVSAYLCALEIGACGRRKYNDFFAGLFHDLPEVLTRDIISPVKRSIEGLEDIVREYESTQIREILLPLLPGTWHEELLYFIRDEFENKVILDGTIRTGIGEEEMSSRYNRDEYAPLDGRLVRACDQLAAFIEARLSVEHGISSPHLLKALDSFGKFFDDRVVAGVDFGRIVDEFL